MATKKKVEAEGASPAPAAAAASGPTGLENQYDGTYGNGQQDFADPDD